MNKISLAKAIQITGAWATTASSYEFDGVDDYIDLGADKPTDLTGDITISVWIKANNLGENNTGTIINNGKLSLYVATGNVLKMQSDGLTDATSDTFTLNIWQHILVTRTSDGIVNFYIDSKLSETGAQSSGIPVAGTTNTFIGNNEAGNKTFNGQIAELKIFSKILSADEISYLYDSTKSKYGN